MSVGIEELVGGDRRPHRDTFNALTAATVRSRAGGEVTVVVPSFTRKQTYDKVPYVKTGTAEPAEGDSGFLHFDDAGHPAYAVIWT